MSSAPVASRTVLLLEDAPDQAARISRWIREAGFQVVHCETLAGALKALSRHTVCAAMVDLCVPDSRGLDTFLAVQERAVGVPVLVQSNLDGELLGVQAVAGGAQDFLRKDELDADRVARALRYALGRHALERELEVSKERLELAMAGARDGIWDWCMRSGSFHTSERWGRLLGLERLSSDEGAAAWLSRVHPDDIAGLRAELNRHLDGDSEHFEHEHRLRREDGTWVWVLVRGVAVRDDEGQATRMAGSLTDVTERRRASERLLHAALHDELTGLPNRSLLKDRLAHLMRRRSHGPYGVLFLDMDRFKVVNDSLGHHVGDEFLVAVAARLQQAVRPSDTVARIGGDEFVVLVECERSLEELRVVADRLHAVLRAPVEVQGHKLHPSASIGVAEGGPRYSYPEELLRDADAAMYRAKRSGRSRSEVFDEELRRWALRRLELEHGIKAAIPQGELELHYQPVVHVESGQIHGVEALLRWRRPSGLLCPGEFLQHATDAGALQEIGTWALHEACENIARLNAVRERPLRLSVNVASCQLREGDLLATVDRALSSSGLAPTQLVLELTETALVENAEQAAGLLRALRERGVQVHLDDFGAGYCGLAYLQQLPVDCLKIDRGFVDGMCEKPANQAIVRAIVGLARGLGLQVVAEGVEHLRQLEVLQEMGCRYAQGYLFGRPVALSALA